MGRPDDLMPGDILLYRNFGLLGSLIAWGEWTGTPREALEYSHIGLVLNDTESCEMNPPASRRFPLSEVPWDRVDVFRVIVKDRGQDVAPLVLASVRQAFQDEAVKRLGERYNYGFIAQSLGLSILARIGLGSWARNLVTRANPLPNKQRDVCSTWVEEILTTAIRGYVPDFDMFPNLGDDRARPSDWPLSPFVMRLP